MTEAASNAWATVAELAAMRGVSSAAISQRVTRLEGAGALRTKAGPNRTKLVPVAQFLRAIEETADPVREQNGSGRPPLLAESTPRLPEDLVYAREQARNTAIRADLAQLELDERLGKLLKVEDVEAAMIRCADALVQAIDQVSANAEDLAAAVAREGVPGLRAALREHARSLRARLAAEMRLLGDSDANPDDGQAPA